jgi:hypothetical protein
MCDHNSPRDAPTVQISTHKWDEERKHLERLFQDRINFYLVFASLFMVGLSQIDDPTIRLWSLIVFSAVSALLCLALLRTRKLVQSALDQITSSDDPHPYSWLRNQSILPNANTVLIWVPIVLTIFFSGVTVYYLQKPHEAPSNAYVGTANADHRCPPAVYNLFDH